MAYLLQVRDISVAGTLNAEFFPTHFQGGLSARVVVPCAPAYTFMRYRRFEIGALVKRPGTENRGERSRARQGGIYALC